MSAYTQMMKKNGAMSKKARKETPTQSLDRELLTDHGAPSPGAPKLAVAEHPPPPPPESQAT
jgi:hypothetical protein